MHTRPTRKKMSNVFLIFFSSIHSNEMYSEPKSYYTRTQKRNETAENTRWAKRFFTRSSPPTKKESPQNR